MEGGTKDAEGREGGVDIKAYNNIRPQGSVEAQLWS